LNVSLQNLVISEVLPTLLGPAVTRVTLDIVNTDDDEDDGTTEHPRVIPDIVQEEIDFTQSFQLCHSLNVIVQRLFISNVYAVVSSLQHFSSSNIFINKKMFLVVMMMS